MHGGRIIFKDGRGNGDKKKSIRCNGGVLEDQMIDPSLYSVQYSDRYLKRQLTDVLVLLALLLLLVSIE